MGGVSAVFRFGMDSELNFIRSNEIYTINHWRQIDVHVSSWVAAAEFGSKNYHKISVRRYMFIVETVTN